MISFLVSLLIHLKTKSFGSSLLCLPKFPFSVLLWLVLELSKNRRKYNEGCSKLNYLPYLCHHTSWLVDFYPIFHCSTSPYEPYWNDMRHENTPSESKIGLLLKPWEQDETQRKRISSWIDNYFGWYFMYGEALQAVERGPNSIQFYIVWFHQNKMDLISF